MCACVRACVCYEVRLDTRYVSGSLIPSGPTDQIGRETCCRCSLQKVQKSLWSDELEPGSYRTMSDSSASDFGPPPSSVHCITGTTNRKVHGTLGTDAPVSGSFSASNTSAHYSGPPLDTCRMPYASTRPDIRDSIDYRPLPPNPSNSLAQTHYIKNAPFSPAQGRQHGARLVSQRSPTEMPRRVRRRTPSPSL